MPPLHRFTPLIVCAAITFVVLGAVGFIPLFGGPGYEASLAAGLLIPGLAAIAAALVARDKQSVPSEAFVRAMEIAIVLVAIAFVLMLLHGARAGFCDASSGFALFVLSPVMGSCMGGAWGFAVGQATLPISRTRLRFVARLALAALAPTLGVIISLTRFFTSPMVFAYDPFFGYFSGTLYDTNVTDSMTTLLSYRAGSLATLVAVGALAFSVRWSEKGWPSLAPDRHPGVLWLAALGAVASLVISIEGDRLGHWQTRSTIEDALGARVMDERCEILYPRSVDSETARLMLHDCATQSRQVTAYLGLDSAPQVRVYVFANADQKRALTGAAHVSVAKPWRKEVYVQLHEYPHPILGHELAHVLAGTIAPGPFKVAGGWLPDPGLIEGIAVAASPDDDVLTPMQWSAAMLRLDVLPRLDDVFALGFLWQHSSTAYTVAGAFVQWIGDRHGMEAVRRWYAGESVDAVVGTPMDELEKTWRAELEGMAISDSALTYAKARFDRPGVFKRRCPHAVDAFNEEGQGLAGSGDCAGATVLFDKAAALDPLHSWSRLNVAACAVRVGGVTAAEEQWRGLAADGMLPEATRLRARESLADLYLAADEPKKADAIYQKLLEQVHDEDRLRTIDVKRRAANSAFEGRAIRALLMGEPGRAPDQALAFSLLGKWMTDVPGDGLPAYLIGRNLVASGSWRAAGEFLDWALERELPEPRVMREALRLRIIAACAVRDEAVARRTFERWKAQPDLQEIRWKVLQRRLGSCVGK